MSNQSQEVKAAQGRPSTDRLYIEIINRKTDELEKTQLALAQAILQGQVYQSEIKKLKELLSLTEDDS